MTNKRGAPLGNKNGFKHGFYSRDFARTDLRDLQAVDLDGLAEEISLTRLHLRKLTEYAMSASSLDDYLEILRVSNLFTSSLNRLVKTHMLLAKDAQYQGDGAEGSLQYRLKRALAEVQATWTVDPPPAHPAGPEDPDDLDDLDDPN